MNVRVGYIPYLNMAPFHHGFGPSPLEAGGHHFEFQMMSPRVLGLQAKATAVDAGALSLVDLLACADQFEPLGSYGIGLKEQAKSVLLFSNSMLPTLQGMCAVTDETSTSFRLLQVLLDVRYGVRGVTYGRIASRMLYDGSANAMLLIGDEALQAKKGGIPGLPVVTDLGEEWYRWQKVPFVFARWAVRRTLSSEAKETIERMIQKSLKQNVSNTEVFSESEAIKRQMIPAEIVDYWQNFAYNLTPDHLRSIELFSKLLEKACV